MGSLQAERGVEAVRQVRVAVRVRGIEGDGAQETIDVGTIRKCDAADAVAA